MLENAQEYGPTDQARLLKLLVASLRPLSIDEIREAMSVTPFNTRWDASKLINNTRTMLATCGSLLFVDEEERTVHFVHPSVEQFLLGDFKHKCTYQFTRDEADLEMANTVLTYLNYDVFNTQLSTTVAQSVPANNVSKTIVSNTLVSSDSIRSLALRLLRSKNKTDFNVGHALAMYNHQFRQQNTFHFRPYAKASFLEHTKNLETCSDDLLSLLWTSSVKERATADYQASLIASTTTMLKDGLMPISFTLKKSDDIWQDFLDVKSQIYDITPRDTDFRSDYTTFYWGVHQCHLGVFRSGLRDPRTGILNMFRITLDLRRGAVDLSFLDLHSTKTYFMLRLLWLAATFGIYDTCSEILKRLGDRLSWTEMHRETYLIAEDHPALPLIVACYAEEHTLPGYGDC